MKSREIEDDSGGELRKAVTTDMRTDILRELEALPLKSVRELRAVVEIFYSTILSLNALDVDVSGVLAADDFRLIKRLRGLDEKQFSVFCTFVTSSRSPAPTETDVNRAETHPKKTAFGSIKKFFRKMFGGVMK